MARTDLKDWAMTVQKGRDCCDLAQKNGARVMAKSVLSVVNQLTDEAISRKNRAFGLAFVAPLIAPAPGAVTTLLNPKIIGAFNQASLRLPAGAIVLASGFALSTLFGQLILLNALSDFSSVITETITQTETEMQKAQRTRTATKRGIFSCDKCVREKSLQQHGSRLAVEDKSL